MKTRAKPKPSGDISTLDSTESKLPPQDPDPPKLFILPKSLSDAAFIVTLAHPRTLTPARFFFCPETGIHELRRFAAPPSACRSILLSPDYVDGEVRVEGSNGDLQPPDPVVDGTSVAEGYILKKAELFVATPIDPLFLALPALSPIPAPSKSDPEKTYFLSAEDLLERLFDTSRHFRLVLRSDAVRKSIESRMAVACDTVEAGDETMYRLSQDKLLCELIRKAEQVIAAGLPPSLEKKCVTRALQRPVTVEVEEVKEVVPFKATVTQEEAIADGVSSEATESQSSVATTNTLSDFPNTTISTPLTVPSPPANSPGAHSPDILRLLRLRTAIEFILSSYFPPHLATALLAVLAAPSSPIDFVPLDAHLTELGKLRAEAAAARTLSNFSRKRACENEFEREEKKRRKEELAEEEKARKKAEPRGLKKLREVDTSGMKKMSAFFKKKS